MKKLFKSVWLFFILGVILGGILAPYNQAQAEDSTSGSCLSNLMPYMATLLDRTSFEDYWQDYFVRNRCQQDDIFALDEESEDMFDELMNEYEKHCASDEITQLREDIKWAKMETYFVRHIVVFDERNTYEKDNEAFGEALKDVETIPGLATQTSDGTAIDSARLYGELKDRYVTKKGWLTEEELVTAMNDWIDEYDYRIPLYWDCNISPWQEVGDKLKELADTFTSLNEVDSFSERAAEIKEEYEQAKKDRLAALEEKGVESGGEKDSPSGKKTIGGFFKKHFAIKMQGVEQLKDLFDLSKEEQEESGGVTIDNLLDKSIAEGQSYNLEETRAKLDSEFWGKYREGSGAITADLVHKINELSQVIVDSTNVADFLPGLKKAAKEVNKKQGKGTPG